MEFIRLIFQNLIVKYLKSCGRVFHNEQYNNYGEPNLGGLYVVAMSDDNYHVYQALANGRTKEEFSTMVNACRAAGVEVS